MRRRVVITDVTRMAGSRVCVAGYTRKTGQPEFCVRPLFRYGVLTEQWLLPRSGIIRPFAVVELDLLKHDPDKPHSEDWLIEPRLRIVQELLGPDERLAFLQAIENPAVGDIFGAEIHHDIGWFVNQREGRRSLGTVCVASVEEIVYRPRSDLGKWEYRIAFRDLGGHEYRLAVTDLAFRLHLDALRDGGMSPSRVAWAIGNELRSVDRLYLRIGLARGWGEFPDRCFLQISGVYSFPDYLGGRCFADFQAGIDGRHHTPPLDDVPF